MQSGYGVGVYTELYRSAQRPDAGFIETIFICRAPDNRNVPHYAGDVAAGVPDPAADFSF
jgi:hypothetical protein